MHSSEPKNYYIGGVVNVSITHINHGHHWIFHRFVFDKIIILVYLAVQRSWQLALLSSFFFYFVMANVKEAVIVTIPDHLINSTIVMSTSEGSLSSDSVESRGSKRNHDSDSDDPHSKSCKTDNAAQSSSVVIREDSSAPTSKEMVQQSVKTVLQTWGRVLPVHPDHFLHTMSTSRGYETSKIPSMQIKQMRYARMFTITSLLSF